MIELVNGHENDIIGKAVLPESFPFVHACLILNLTVHDTSRSPQRVGDMHACISSGATMGIELCFAAQLAGSDALSIELFRRATRTGQVMANLGNSSVLCSESGRETAHHGAKRDKAGA